MCSSRKRHTLSTVQICYSFSQYLVIFLLVTQHQRIGELSTGHIYITLMYMCLYYTAWDNTVIFSIHISLLPPPPFEGILNSLVYTPFLTKKHLYIANTLYI